MKILDMIEAGPLTYDDEDVELRIAGDEFVVKDLKEDANPESAGIKKTSLREYLSRARGEHA